MVWRWNVGERRLKVLFVEGHFASDNAKRLEIAVTFVKAIISGWMQTPP